MRNIMIVTAFAVAGCINAPQAQDKLTSNSSDGLADLNGMTFDCPKAGLNAAAREAAKVPSQGTYQFSYFRIINDAHHASYEVHFKSNYVDEPELRYCVLMYCQQGWDPKTTRIDVRPMSGEACGAHADTAKRKDSR